MTSLACGGMHEQSDLPDDHVDLITKGISATAGEALEYLRMREEFWNQLQLGSGVKLDGRKEKRQ